MAEQNRNSYGLLWMLGAAMTLPAILVSGPVAGYLIGHYILFRIFGLPSWVVLTSVGFGFVGSALQVYRLIRKFKELDSGRD